MTTLHLNSEELIIKKIKNSNTKAFKTVFDFYYSRIVSYFYTRLSDAIVAEDLAQQVFINIWNSRERLDENKQFSSYLFTAAKNSLIDYYRKKNESHSELDESIAVSNIDFVENDTMSDQILELLHNLSDQHRVTFLLHRLDGFSYKELADCFGISVKAVEKRISTVLRFLRDKLK